MFAFRALHVIGLENHAYYANPDACLENKRGPRRGLAPKRQRPLGGYASHILRCEGDVNIF